MSDIESYRNNAEQFINEVNTQDPHVLVDEFGILSTSLHDEDEGGDASVVFTLGGPTVYLAIGDAVEFHYRFGDDSYSEVLSADTETMEAVKSFVEATETV